MIWMRNERRRKKRIICTYRTKDWKEKKKKKKNKKKKVTFNIMPSLCSKVTSHRYHLLVCVCVLYIQNDGLLIFNVQKHCPSIWPPRDLCYVRRVTKEIVRNDDDDDATTQEEKKDVKKKIKERWHRPPLSIRYTHTHIYIYIYTYIEWERERRTSQIKLCALMIMYIYRKLERFTSLSFFCSLSSFLIRFVSVQKLDDD
jgi:hypothetical protein